MMLSIETSNNNNINVKELDRMCVPNDPNRN